MPAIKSPEYDYSLTTGTIVREPVNGSVVRRVKNSNWPDKYMFNLEFRNLNRTDKDGLLAVILSSRPVTAITLADVHGEDYEVIILGDVTINQRTFNRERCADDSLYDVSFKVEGIKL